MDGAGRSWRAGDFGDRPGFGRHERQPKRGRQWRRRGELECAARRRKQWSREFHVAVARGGFEYLSER